MKIGIAGPVALNMIPEEITGNCGFPSTYSFAQTTQIAVALHALGHDVSLFGMSQDLLKTERYSFHRFHINICPLRERARSRALDFFKEERRHLTEAMLDDRCDIIHAHWTYEFALAALKSEMPVVVHIHDAPYAILRYYRDAYRFIRLLMAQATTLKCHTMIANSEYTYRHFRKYLFYRRSCKVIPNAIPDALLLPESQHALPDAPVFATIAIGWSRRKNVARLIQAYAKVVKALPDARLILIGDGYGPGETAEQWAKSKKLEQGIDFRGKLDFDALIDALRRDVTIYVHPSLEESFGNAIVESMAQYIPVIGGMNSGAVPWVLDQGRCGLLTDVTRPEILADAIIGLYNDKASRKRLAETAWKRVALDFTLSSIIPQYMEIYESAIRAGKT